MVESEARFLERLRDDVARRLGPGIQLGPISASHHAGRTRLTATYEAPIGTRTTAADGASLLEAAGALLAKLPEERLAVAFRQLVEAESPSRG